jgi:hypothetical protein
MLQDYYPYLMENNDIIEHYHMEKIDLSKNMKTKKKLLIRIIIKRIKLPLQQHKVNKLSF